MREDMAKVIVERPRRGNGWRRKGGAEAVVDDDGVKVRGARGNERRSGQKSKNLNENLAPLQRFLASRAGKRWNKVRSEVAEYLKPTSTVQQHVVDHLKDLVALDVKSVDGELMVAQRFGRTWSKLGESGFRLYVHPRSGLLLKNKDWRAWASTFKRPAPITDRRRELGPFRQAHRLADGAWWDVVLEAVPVKRVTERNARGEPVVRKVPQAFEDVILVARRSRRTPEELYGRQGVFAVSARRFTRLERQKLDLS
jgi:hypothetical protein